MSRYSQPQWYFRNWSSAVKFAIMYGNHLGVKMRVVSTMTENHVRLWKVKYWWQDA